MHGVLREYCNHLCDYSRARTHRGRFVAHPTKAILELIYSVGLPKKPHPLQHTTLDYWTIPQLAAVQPSLGHHALRENDGRGYDPVSRPIPCREIAQRIAPCLTVLHLAMFNGERGFEAPLAPYEALAYNSEPRRSLGKRNFLLSGAC